MTMAEGGIMARRLHAHHRRQEFLLLELAAMDRHEAFPAFPSPRSASGCASLRARQRSCVIRPRARCRRSRPNGLVVCDSLAILEYLAERHPELHLWPQDAEARAVARSISAEMHSGFVTLRNEMSDGSARQLPHPADRRRACPRYQPHRGDLAWRRGRDMAREDHSCSAPSPMPTPCMRRWRRASARYGVDLAAFGDDGTAAAYAETILALARDGGMDGRRASRNQGAARRLKPGVRTSYAARRRAGQARSPAPAQDRRR